MDPIAPRLATGTLVLGLIASVGAIVSSVLELGLTQGFGTEEIVMISIALSRVFSPQFWVWIGGLAALALINKETKLKKVIVLLSISAFITQLIYPGQYVQLLSGDVFATLLQLMRVTLFVWALVLGTKLLLKPTNGKVNEYV